MFITELVQSSTNKALQNLHENHRSIIFLTDCNIHALLQVFFRRSFSYFQKKSNINLFEFLASTCVLLQAIMCLTLKCFFSLLQKASDSRLSFGLSAYLPSDAQTHYIQLPIAITYQISGWLTRRHFILNKRSPGRRNKIQIALCICTIARRRESMCYVS